MTRMEDVVAQSRDAIDHKMIDTILTDGHSFPIHETGNPLVSRSALLTYDPAKELPVSSFPLSIFSEALPSVSKHRIICGAIAVITLEVVRDPRTLETRLYRESLLYMIEEIVSEEIVDKSYSKKTGQSPLTKI
ncbi:hypothetical protein EV421DRAFT_1737917 [Armillaria borealis]|uniref:Uncharacterized protein n=1 Tax=Armillaria borealis TaxID=47425 RepID=A0AA39JB62_9AGAR|nr:hypothetical protein EV421DRAFT_1737917 [Armillaria borealis]